MLLLLLLPSLLLPSLPLLLVLLLLFLQGLLPYCRDVLLNPRYVCGVVGVTGGTIHLDALEWLKIAGVNSGMLHARGGGDICLSHAVLQLLPV